MPISREAFQLRVPGGQDEAAEEVADAFDLDITASAADPLASVNRGAVRPVAEANSDVPARNEEESGAKKSQQRSPKEESANLPPADPTSAEKKEAFGAAHPQRETHRSVATGRDVPQFTTNSPHRENAEINWEEARGQMEISARRAQSQKSDAAEHLSRIHDIVGLLIEMSEAYSNDGERKLQSLENKVSELEMRYAVNRSSP